MNVFDRIYALHKQLAGARRPIPKATLEERLECSPATVKRIIRDMRLYLDAPIEYDRNTTAVFIMYQAPQGHAMTQRRRITEP